MHVEELVSASVAGHAINRNTAVWLGEISDVLHNRLARVGLIKPGKKAPAVTLGAFTADYVESRRVDTKPRTIINLTQARKELVRYFGEDKPMAEVLALRWTDIDWENNLITVRCPKLEHLEGHETRVIPLFRELKPILLQAFGESPTGSEFVITKYRGGHKNLRTQFTRIIRRAGVEPWGMPFQNLRSSRETELNEIYPWYTVCTWMGHSREVASEHYLTVPVEHYARAVASEATPPGSAAQNPAQQMHAGPRKRSHNQGDEEEETAGCGAIPQVATPCEHTESQPIPPRGVEPLSPG